VRDHDPPDLAWARALVVACGGCTGVVSTRGAGVAAAVVGAAGAAAAARDDGGTVVLVWAGAAAAARDAAVGVVGVSATVDPSVPVDVVSVAES